jgi:hypothetical protein
MVIKKIIEMTIVTMSKFSHKFSINEELLNFSNPIMFFIPFLSLN